MALPRVRVKRVQRVLTETTYLDVEGDVIGCTTKNDKTMLIIGCDDGRVEQYYLDTVEYLPEDEG